MATAMVVHKVAAYGGGQTSAMNQMTAQAYLGKLVGGTRLTNLSQALNQAFNDQGKSNGTKRYNGQQTLHASAGKAGVSSVSLFYYLTGSTIYLFAMGQHAGASSYELCDFKPDTGDFSAKTISL